jgi:hypothetical protein
VVFRIRSSKAINSGQKYIQKVVPVTPFCDRAHCLRRSTELRLRLHSKELWAQYGAQERRGRFLQGAGEAN